MVEDSYKEEKKEQEKQDQGEGMNPQDLMKEYERVESIINTDQVMFQKMMDMDVRIKYSFIKTLHNNLTSINSRFNWKPEELMGIGMLFGDLNGIERTVFNQVMSDMDNEDDASRKQYIVRSDPHTLSILIIGYATAADPPQGLPPPIGGY